MATKIGNKYIEEVSAGTIEVGGENIFSPKMKFKKWDGTADFSIELVVDGVKGTDIYDDITKKTKWKNTTTEIEFYPIADGSGYEFDIILKNKSKSRILTLLIISNGLKFYKQPPMTEEIGIDGVVTANETEGFNAQGQRIKYRPEQYVNSYAIYKTGEIINIRGGIEYKSAKVGHILRIKAIDDDGVSTWCPMEIIDNIMTITVPEDFWNSAKFPLHIDPSFGYTTIGASSFGPVVYPICHIGSGLIHTAGSKFIITKFTIYGSGGTVETAAYNIQSGLPVNQLASGVAIALPGSAAWTDSAAVNQLMQNGETYGMAVGVSVAGSTLYYDVTTGNQRSAETRTGALQTPWSSASVSASQYSWYATYEQFNEDLL
jgi:hypothetical protein